MRFVRPFVVYILGTLALSGVAAAQSDSKGYVEGVAQSAFGNVTSQSYGGEFGITVVPSVQVFVEGGVVRNIATPDITASAQQIAAYLSRTQASVGYTVKQPVTFGVVGVRFVVPTTGRVQPYVMGGGGLASVKQNVTFRVGGTDVTANLPQYGVQLGSDLSSSFRKPMFVVGGGINWAIWQRMVLDFQYRYGRILAQDGAINVGRAGIGIGVRF
jgi:opacity protein-like surface antigen